MNILHLESSPGWGGQEIRILSESLGMKERGHKIFFAVAKGGLLIPKAKETGFLVREIRYQKIFWFFSFFYLLYLMLKWKIDIVNTHSSEDSWLGGAAARLLGKKVIRTRHLSTTIKGGLNSLLLYGKLTDFVVTTCSEIIPSLYRESKKPLKYFRCIPTGTDTKKISFDEKASQALRDSLKLKEGDLLLGTVCFMRSWKGIKDFLKAAEILKADKQLKWIVVGGGHASTYMELAKQMGLHETLVFTGHLDNPLYAIAALDIFLLLSTAHEGISQASLQAAYLKKPLITTGVGGLKEVCLHEKTGLIVPPFSPQKVASAVLQLKNDAGLRNALGQKGKELIEQKFTYEIMLDEMEAVYKQLFRF